jgi:hypothetical protein
LIELFGHALRFFSHKRNTNLGRRRTIRSATLTSRVIRVLLVQLWDLNGTLIVDRRRIQGFIANLAGSDSIRQV